MNDDGATEDTLYGVAGGEMQRLIGVYLRLLDDTEGLSRVTPATLSGLDERRIVLAGIGADEDADTVDAVFAAEEVKRRSAGHFDVETAITTGVYLVLRRRVAEQIEALAIETSNFRSVKAEYIQSHAYLLPVFMRIAGVFSKAELKKRIGTASDQRVGASAAEKLSELLQRQASSAQPFTQGEILRSMDATLEGIVRDLVGRLLLESLVENALKLKDLTYKRESEYGALQASSMTSEQTSCFRTNRRQRLSSRFGSHRRDTPRCTPRTRCSRLSTGRAATQNSSAFW